MHMQKYMRPQECCYVCGRMTFDYKKVRDYMLGKVTVCLECADGYDGGFPDGEKHQDNGGQ